MLSVSLNKTFCSFLVFDLFGFVLFFVWFFVNEFDVVLVFGNEIEVNKTKNIKKKEIKIFFLS